MLNIIVFLLIFTTQLLCFLGVSFYMYYPTSYTLVFFCFVFLNTYSATVFLGVFFFYSLPNYCGFLCGILCVCLFEGCYNKASIKANLREPAK